MKLSMPDASSILSSSFSFSRRSMSNWTHKREACEKRRERERERRECAVERFASAYLISQVQLILARRVARVEDALARLGEEILRGAAVLQAQITHGALYADRFDDGVDALVTDRVAVELQRS